MSDKKITIDDLAEIIGEVIDISRTNVDLNSVFGEDIPVDSKDMLRILSRIESRYKFRFEFGEIVLLRTVNDLYKSTLYHTELESNEK